MSSCRKIKMKAKAILMFIKPISKHSTSIKTINYVYLIQKVVKVLQYRTTEKRDKSSCAALIANNSSSL